MRAALVLKKIHTYLINRKSSPNIVLRILVVSLFITSFSSYNLHTEAAGTYTLNLTVIERSAENRDSIYDADTYDESTETYIYRKLEFDSKNGVSHCSQSNRIVDVTPTPIIYGKIGKGSKIRVLDGAGKILGLATLSKVSWTQSGTPRYAFTDRTSGNSVNTVSGTCSYSAKIRLKKSDFYTFQITGTQEQYPGLDFSFKDLQKKKWRITLRF